MNISQPVASSLSGVSFEFLLSDEIKRYSVKRISNTSTFDSLLNPTPGGLYDLALGAYAGNPCSTCHLSSDSCPGHAGHIELPVPVYQPLFMTQIYRLLRCKCRYCHRFRCPRVESNLLLCKLQLLQYGLIVESSQLDTIRPEEDANGQDDGSEDESRPKQQPAERAQDDLIRRRNAYVESVLHQTQEALKSRLAAAGRLSTVSTQRRALIRGFLAQGLKRKCSHCNGISPSLRKDGAVKLFEKTLTGKELSQNALAGVDTDNPLVVVMKEQNRRSTPRRTGTRTSTAIDEAIADMDLGDENSHSSSSTASGSDTDLSSDESNVAKFPIVKPKEESVKQSFVSSGEARAALSLLFEKDQELMRALYGHYMRSDGDQPKPLSADIFFANHIMVPPNRYRPDMRTGAEEVAEAPQNTLLKSILTRSQVVSQISMDIVLQSQSGLAADEGVRSRTAVDLMKAWVGLQEAVNALFDKDLNPVQGKAAQRNPDGLKQLLEKKEGLFRMNMMGKRVNFAARSVISPDPNIETNEVGVPPVFAEKLTYPEPVTDHNYRELANCVINGEHWPGASAVENERGEVINLRFKSLDERMAIANSLLAPSSAQSNGTTNKKVYRHLRDGDVVLMNRQPTLHKPSIMGHKTRVLRQEKTLRMHYANCNTYNADFDGDEMNMHLPQNVIAQTEALLIADTDHQYLSATAGKPLRGLIQDHISISVWMSNKDTWFTQDEYHQLIYSCLRPEQSTSDGRILTTAPAIIKPRALWSGKQIITTILANIQPPDQPGITMARKSTVSAQRWVDHVEEGIVEFSKGYFVSGVLDKSQLGPTSYGLIHAIHELYGPTVAGTLLGVTSRLLTKFLSMRAFSCGIEDLLLTPRGNAERQKSLQKARDMGVSVASEYVSIEDKDLDEQNEELSARLEELLRDGDKQGNLDRVYNSRTAQLTGEITSACLPDGLRKLFPRNQMQTMTGSGAKGSPVNASLISCNLGQQVLEGRRVPIMVSGRSLPCFDPYETHIRAGGYITDRFLTGVRPQEYFFHCMAGREGLIDTAVKTSRSGYLQRCLIKGMEGVRVEYDHSVRDSDGSLVQTLFGEDSLDITKRMHLEEFRFIAENSDAFFAHLNLQQDLGILQTLMNEEAAKYNEKVMRLFRRTQNLGIDDPSLAKFLPTRWLGSTSESFAQALKEYVDTNPDRLILSKRKRIEGIPKNHFKALANLKYMKSVIDPGEAVGVVAGQSIGEPSTQMTLNTFHLAGHSSKNVTLGIPRLREIVMTASADIKTPTMTLALIPELEQADRELFAKSISKLTLAELIDKVSVSESGGSSDHKTFGIRIEFYPGAEYTSHYGVQVSKVGDVLELDFVQRLQLAIRQEFKKKAKERSSAVVVQSDAIPQIGQAARKIAGEEARPGADADGGLDDDDEDDDGEGDATNTKQKANQRQPISYEDADDDGDPNLVNDPLDAAPEDEGIGGSPPESDAEAADSIRATGTQERPSQKSERGARVQAENADVSRFSFDEKRGDWCEIELRYPRQNAKMLALNIVERTARLAVIQQIPGIGTGTLIKETVTVGGQPTELFSVVTDGINLVAMRDYQHLANPHRMTSNDIAAMLQHYGVEACRATIVREMDAVFSGHGIAVDARHLSLIADFMTKGGGFRPFNRVGMRDATSPFMKMSFETTVNFLRDAVLEGEREDLSSPSARIVTGRLGRMGTGSFDVLTLPDARP